jgi:lambda repressor-like predicted transcriptional regulator|tara:strand:- start:427 stop:639 length:213 start_codon:yes stop_codon:yes gene_type:complete
MPRTFNVEGKSLTIKEISIESGLSTDVLHKRLSRGWPVNKAMNTSLYSKASAGRLANTPWRVKGWLAKCK